MILGAALDRNNPIGVSAAAVEIELVRTVHRQTLRIDTALLSIATYTLSAPVAAQVICMVGGLVGGTVKDTSGAGGTPQPPEGTIEKLRIFGPAAAVTGGAVVGGFVAGGAVGGAKGVVLTAVVAAGRVATTLPDSVVTAAGAGPSMTTGNLSDRRDSRRTCGP